jgi:hypothetical protein
MSSVTSSENSNGNGNGNENGNVNGTEDVLTLLERVLETQQQIADSFIVKEPDVQYYGWFSEVIQSRRIYNPSRHTLGRGTSNPVSLTSPPYTYWLQGKKKVLVTDVTLTNIVMKRHKESNSVFLGKLDKFCCRSYTKL